jgi:hypothetical protein
MFSGSLKVEDLQKLMQVNRRRSVRRPEHLGVSCSIVEDGDSGNLAQVIDLWQSGIRLLTHRRHQPGSYLHITLSNAAELFRHSAVIVVRFAIVTSDGTHVARCEFLQELAHAHLRTLLTQE